MRHHCFNSVLLQLESDIKSQIFEYFQNIETLEVAEIDAVKRN